MRYNLDVDYFKNIDTSEKSFWLGFICADGSIKSNRGKPYLKITQYNDILLNRFKKDISFGGNVKLVKNQKGRYSDNPFYEITIYSAEFSQNILDLGKTRYKKDQKEIPFSIPNKYIIDFIRGYFEGDGSISFNISNNNWIVRISGEIELLESINKYIKIGTIQKDKSIGVLSISGNNNVEKFMNAIYYNEYSYGIKHLKYRGESYWE